jgi:cyclopropane fatty-acyl-phospholipid synthase-like methyltransferase
MVIKRLPLRADQHLLDVGCGLGRPALRIARETGCAVTGITISQKQVTEANQRATAAGLGERVRFQLANAMELPLVNEMYDAAWALESLLHMPDREQVLREMRRVVMPGGRIAISDMILRSPMTDEEAAFIRSAFLMPSAIPLQDYQQLIAKSGLELEEVLDISANTMQTLPRLMENIERQSEAVRQLMGDSFLAQVRAGWSQAAALYQKCLGYVLIVARRPNDR